LIAKSHDADGRPVPGLVQLLAQHVAGRLRQEFLEHEMAGLRPVHTPLLAALLGGARRAADLAVTVGVSRQAVAQVLANLERGGYLERIADPGDSRAKLVCLTAKGRAALRLMRTNNLSLEDEWRERIGGERMADLREILAQLLSPPDRI